MEKIFKRSAYAFLFKETTFYNYVIVHKILYTP